MLDVVESPAPVEHWLQRAVEAEHCEEALPRDGLDPVAVVGLRRFGTEEEIDRAVSIARQLDQARAPGALLVRVDHAARTGVVDSDRPEGLGRWVCVEVQPVAAPALQERARAVVEGRGVPTALPRYWRGGVGIPGVHRHLVPSL